MDPGKIVSERPFLNEEEIGEAAFTQVARAWLPQNAGIRHGRRGERLIERRAQGSPSLELPPD